MGLKPFVSEELAAENRLLRDRLHAAEETVRAIQGSEVDAFVMGGEGQERVCTLGGADESYRSFVEAMGQGALTVSADGTILYCNPHLASLLRLPVESLPGTSFFAFVGPEDEG